MCCTLFWRSGGIVTSLLDEWMVGHVFSIISLGPSSSVLFLIINVLPVLHCILDKA